MSGGSRRLVFNTRERAVSSDQNRHQAFGQRELAEVLRMLVDCRNDTQGGGFLESGSFASTVANIVETPLRADVFDGLTVVPQPSSLNLLVSPGVIGLDDPDGQAGSSDPDPPSPDDSEYKIVIDPGIVVSGALAVAPGAGSTRIDLVEVRRQTVVLETDSRDVFDPSTGVFLPVTVTKVEEGRLIYRVRQGAPGAGIPALAQGWVPLCVISVPSSAVSVDTMTFWDVRPLVKDRVNAPHDQQVSIYGQARGGNLYANDHSVGGKTTLSGHVEGAIGMYRAGGVMPFGTRIIDVRAAANQASGYGPVPNSPWYLYAVFPAGLPRWVQYDVFPNLRIPSGPLGVITVSEAGPSDELGTKFVNPPPATGLVTSGRAVLLAGGNVAAGPAEKGFVMQDGLILFNPDAPIPGPGVVAGASTDTYTLVAGVHFPLSARSVLVKVAATFSGAPASSFDQIHTTLTVRATGTTDRVANAWDANLPVVYSSGGGGSTSFRAEAPIYPLGTTNGESGNLVLVVEWSTITARSLQSLNVLGWRL